MVQGLVKAFWDLGLVCLVLRGAISTAGDRAASFLQVGVVIGTFGCLRKQDAALQSMWRFPALLNILPLSGCIHTGPNNRCNISRYN